MPAGDTVIADYNTASTTDIKNRLDFLKSKNTESKFVISFK